MWCHFCQTSRRATVCLQASWPVERHKCQIPIKVLTFSGISSPTALKHYMVPEQPPVPLTAGPSRQQELDWCAFVCVGISFTDKSTDWAWIWVLPSSYCITSFKIKWYLSVHRSSVDAWGFPICCPLIVYTGMCRHRCLFTHLFFIFGLLLLFRTGFWRHLHLEYNELIIGIWCTFLCTIVCNRIHHFICLIKTIWNT